MLNYLLEKQQQIIHCTLYTTSFCLTRSIFVYLPNVFFENRRTDLITFTDHVHWNNLCNIIGGEGIVVKALELFFL